MKYEDLRAGIKTGDLLLCSGDSLASEIIEKATDGRFSHVAVFFWMDDGLFIAEEWQTSGFQIMPASQKIAQVEGKCFLGIAPESVRDNNGGVLTEISLYRSDKSKQPYGWDTLVKVFNADEFGTVYDSAKVQAVCSVFAQLCWAQCKYVFKTLVSPSDFEVLCAGTVEIEKEA